MDTVRQYGRDDVNYDDWYSQWMKDLASKHTLGELQSKLGVTNGETAKAAGVHLRAIERTHSMTSNSAARAHSRNVVAASGDYSIAIRGAIEIHELFPEKAKGE